MIQSSGLNRFEIVFRYPRLPVLLQGILGDGQVLHLPKSILVDDIVIICILKDARCYPRLP